MIESNYVITLVIYYQSMYYDAFERYGKNTMIDLIKENMFSFTTNTKKILPTTMLTFLVKSNSTVYTVNNEGISNNQCYILLTS